MSFDFDLITCSHCGERYPLSDFCCDTNFNGGMKYSEFIALSKSAAQPNKAMKFDDGKPPIDLVDKELILEVAKVLGYGAGKYEAHNWRVGLPLSRYYSACQRHLLAWNDGETLDPESGLPHLAHAACNLMFMLNISKNKPSLDDRHSFGALDESLSKSSTESP